MMLLDDSSFNTEVEKMFEDDFANSREVRASEYTDRNFFFRLSVKIARLFAPIQ